MDFKQSVTDAGNKNVMRTNQLSSSQANVLESMILDQSDRERRSKNVLVFGVRKYLNMSYDFQRKDDESKIKEILKEIGFGVSKVVSSFRFKSKPYQMHDPPILVRLKSQPDRDELMGLGKLFRNSDKFNKIFLNKDLNEVERKLERDYCVETKTRRK